MPDDDDKPAYLSERWVGPAAPRVLLVDDDANVRRATARFLKRAGFEVVAVESGDAALASVRSGEVFDVAVLDIEMPGMDGAELLRHLRAEVPGLPVGIYSASDRLRELDRTQLAGAAFLKSKMRPVGELVQALSKAIYDRGPAN